MRSFLPTLLLLATLFAPGCFYKVGSGLMAGVLDETAGEGESGGIDTVVEGLVERELMARLGQQLGEGLQSGVTDISPEQRRSLESVVDGLITVATLRAGEGLRRDVSPELRALVQRDIVETFAEGIRGELGASLEETVDRVVTRAILALRRGLEDDDFKYATADMLRDSIYQALREGSVSPAVGETLQVTLEENVLDPFSTNIGDLAELIALQVDKSTRRTEDTLKAVIGALVIIIGGGGIAFFIVQRRLRREKATRSRKEIDFRSLAGALGELDEGTRAKVQHKMDELKHLIESDDDRSEDYLR